MKRMRRMIKESISIIVRTVIVGYSQSLTICIEYKKNEVMMMRMRMVEDRRRRNQEIDGKVCIVDSVFCLLLNYSSS
jgi:hypothetical protein